MSNRSDKTKIDNKSVKELFVEYEIYKGKTIRSDHGKTAQYFAIFTNLVHYYPMLSHSVRTSDFELLKFVLLKITNPFFAFNQQNSSRYSVLYHDNLLQVDSAHSGLKENFLESSFDIKRAAKAFSRQPIDMTL